MQRMETLTVAERYDVLAPDSSEIRLLVSTDRGSMVHCTLAAGRTSLAVRHCTVEEVWYFLGGHGEVWRKLGGEEQVVAVQAGVSLTVPTGAHFQFRAIGAEPLTFVIVTMPPWPGEAEAARVTDYWPVPRGST